MKNHSKYPQLYEQYQRLRVFFPLSIGNMVSYQLEAISPEIDSDIQFITEDAQKKYKTSFLPEDLYFISYFFINHLKTISNNTLKGVYDREKTTRTDALELLELLDLLQDGKVDIKKISLQLKSPIRTISFESKEIILYFLNGIYERFRPFIGGTDFIKIREEVELENKGKYKQGKNKNNSQNKMIFIKQFLKELHSYIKLDPCLKSEHTYPNKQMLFIADLVQPAQLIHYFDNSSTQSKNIRDYFRD